MAERVLRVWVLSDGRPGHYNQSRGILRALQRVMPVEDCWIAVELRFGLARNILRMLLNRSHRVLPLRLLRVFCKLGELPDGDCDLLLSTGGRTSFASAWLARALEVPNVYAGSLRRLSPQLFSAVLTQEPIPGAENNLLLALPPSPIEAQGVQRAGQRLRDELGLADARCWTMLLGGNGAGYRYRHRDWLALAQLMQCLSERFGVRWLLVSSRRTGRAAEQLLRRHLNQGVLAGACWYGQVDSYHAEAYLGAAERVFVTEDSMTMLAEAIHSVRPVVSLCAQIAAPTARYEQALQRYVAHGWLCRYSIAGLLDHPQALDTQPCGKLEKSPSIELGEKLKEILGIV